MEVTFFHSSVDSAEEWDVRSNFIPAMPDTKSTDGYPRRTVIVLSIAEDSSKSHRDHASYFFRNLDDLFQFEDAIRTAVAEICTKAGSGPRAPKPSQPRKAPVHAK